MTYLRLTITDTMGFWDDYLSDYIFDPTNSKTFTNWYRVPDEWLQDGTLIPERREQLFKHLYGSEWRRGNGDGSKYVILKIEEHELSDVEKAQRVWANANDLCYAVNDDSIVENVSRDAM